MSPIFSEGKRISFDEKKTIFDYADILKVRVPTSCGRTGECHECIVEIRTGNHGLNAPPNQESFLKGNYRLACQTRVVDPNVDIEFTPLRRQPRILSHTVKRNVNLNPTTQKISNKVFLNSQYIEDYKGKILGISGDIGTTTVVLNLIDLESGTVLYTSSFENPQGFGGSDVMNRISYESTAYKGELRKVIISSINFEIGVMTRELGLHRRQIYDIVLVGNSTMRDILFGVDVQSIGEKPYKSLIQHDYESGLRPNTSLQHKAMKMGIRVSQFAEVYSGPLISSHIGSDVSADLLAIEMDKSETNIMLVDIGTNTEVVIGNRDRMVTASCPAGPAFEGGEIRYGMPGYDGAIEAVSIKEGQADVSVIGNNNPTGICGSGLVDLLAELRRTNLMNDLGVLKDGTDRFVFEKESEMALYRSDISSLAQAKSANYSGQYIALRTFGEKIENISGLYLAGGFANYVNTENAKDIGFIANFPSDKIQKVGNAALEGATIMCQSIEMRKELESLVSKIEHIELETTDDFFDIFVEGCMFKPMPTELI